MEPELNVKHRKQHPSLIFGLNSTGYKVQSTMVPKHPRKSKFNLPPGFHPHSPADI